MLSPRFCSFLVALCLLITSCSSIFPCSTSPSYLWDERLDELIDNEFQDCGFEGPLPGGYDDYEHGSPIATMTFDLDRHGNNSKLWLNFLISPRADPDQWNRNEVRDIIFRGNGWKGLLPLVEHAISKMHGLEEVHWEMDVPMTENILRSLENNNPNSRIYYQFSTWNGPWTPLANSTLLYSLKADIDYGYDDNYRDMDFVFTALSKAPNIRELDLYLHADKCELGGGNPWAFPFETNPSVRFPPLEVLKLDGYELDERADGGQCWAWRGKGDEWNAQWKIFKDSLNPWAKPPIPPERPEDNGQTNLQAWFQVMDWSHLHTLHISYPASRTLDELRNADLPALTNVSFKAGNGWGAPQPEILAFIANGTTQPLHSLSLQNMGAESGDGLLGILSTYPNLTRELRHFSYGGGGENTFFLNQTKLSTLLSSSPKIEHLDINVPRTFNTSLPAGPGLFHDILSSPTLKKLTLRVPTPDEHYNGMGVSSPGPLWDQYSEMQGKYYNLTDIKDDEPDPIFHHEALFTLFENIKEWKKGEALELLEVYVGDWDLRGYRGMIGNLLLRVAHWECSVKFGCEGQQTRLIE